MVRIYSMILPVFLSAGFLWGQTVSLSGTVKKTGGSAGISGVNVSLAKMPNLSATTDAQGSFVISGTSAVQRQTQRQPRFHSMLAENTLIICGVFQQQGGRVEAYASNGRKNASISFKGNSAGVQRITLPEFGSGLTMLRIVVRGETVTQTVVRLGDALYLKNAPSAAGSGRNFIHV